MELTDNEKSKVFSLLGSLKDISGSENTLSQTVLIVDGLNTFIRAWCSLSFMNDVGVHSGGTSGFLMSLGSAIKLFNPSRCILVFDGNGGSQKRRKIYPEYKSKRKTSVHLNRAYADSITPEQEQESVKNQLLRTVHYIDCLPVTTVCIDNIEADDTIAFLAKDTFKDRNVVIMSADKDFLQLASDKIKIWSPTKKKVYGCAELMMEYGVSCENFINVRILEGDDSDNIPGIKGAGLKTIKKLFPIFSDHHRYSVQEILNYCDTHKGKYKLYDTILENKDILFRNYELMQLHETQIQSFTQLRILDTVNKKVNKLNRYKFAKLVTEDKIWNNIPNYQTWLNDCFLRLNSLIVD